MDNLIARGKVQPMIVVMPNGNPYEPEAANDNTAPPSNTQMGGPSKGSLEPLMPYPNSIVHDVLPFVDRSYRTISDRDHRAIAGSPLGGLLEPW